jgi:hypothetical protein
MKNDLKIGNQETENSPSLHIKWTLSPAMKVKIDLQKTSGGVSAWPIQIAIFSRGY